MTTINGPIIPGGQQQTKQQTIVAASIGPTRTQEVQDSIEASLKFASEQGFMALHLVIPDLTIWNRWGVNAMRNMAFKHAILKHDADQLLILDNDVLLREDTIMQLAARNPGIVTPTFDLSRFLTQEQIDNGSLPPTLMYPFWSSGQGIAQVDWAVASCLMFNRLAMNILKPNPFTTQKMVTIEEYDCLTWAIHGIDTYVNTDVVVGLLTPPTERYAAESAPVLKPEERRYKWTREQEHAERLKVLAAEAEASGDTGSG